MQGKLTPAWRSLNARTSLLRAIGNPTDLIQFASCYRPTHVIWYPTRCSAANKKYPKDGIKIQSKLNWMRDLHERYISGRSWPTAIIFANFENSVFYAIQL